MITREWLIDEARQIAESAYAPYSKFRVGAVAVMEKDGYRLPFRGCNIESASYGLTLCAERVAVAGGVRLGYRKLVSLTVACIDATGEMPVASRMPCGACRQFMAEFASEGTLIVVDGVSTYLMDELLPRAFRL